MAHRNGQRRSVGGGGRNGPRRAPQAAPSPPFHNEDGFRRTESLIIWHGAPLEAGELSLPFGYRPYGRYPLVVLHPGSLSMSRDKGALVEAFSARGYAALVLAGSASSTGRLESCGVGGMGDFEACAAGETHCFVDRGIKLLVERGLADAARVGLVGLGPAARPALHALLRSSRISAAAFIDCCLEREAVPSLWHAAAEMSAARSARAARNRGSSISQGAERDARRIDTPILLQVPEEELLGAADCYTALRGLGAPTDLFFFRRGGAGHLPGLQAEDVCQRTLDWFDFWLRGVKPDAERCARELAYWQRLRERKQSATD